MTKIASMTPPIPRGKIIGKQVGGPHLSDAQLALHQAIQLPGPRGIARAAARWTGNITLRLPNSEGTIRARAAFDDANADRKEAAN
jgi:hypothetical protein